MLRFFLTEVIPNFKVWAEHETLNGHHLFAQSAQISYVKVQNLERDLARRALVSEAPEASQGPKGPIWRVVYKAKFHTFADIFCLSNRYVIFYKKNVHNQMTVCLDSLNSKLLKNRWLIIVL